MRLWRHSFIASFWTQTNKILIILLVFRWELIVFLLLQICFFFFFLLWEIWSLSQENQADIIEAFNSTSRYLDDLLSIDNIYFDQMVDRIYPTELQLNRENSSGTEAPFLDLNLCISYGTVSHKIYDDFDFDIVNFPFLDDDVPRISYGVYISQLKRFARASSNLIDSNYRYKSLTAKLLRQDYRYFKLCKAFPKFYRRHSALVKKL